MLKQLFAIVIACLCVQFVFAQSFQQQCLRAHNRFRALHRNTPNLVLDRRLTNFAQQWANHLANTGRLQHRPNNPNGENLYAQFGNTNVNGGQAVRSWYDEIRFYDFNNPGFSMRTGHFTQVVWKNSRRLGCAVAKRGSNAYVVANYAPPGNVLGQFPQNVLRRR